jgi:glucose-6-phosphate-specific signal transduction histidine kinase
MGEPTGRSNQRPQARGAGPGRGGRPLWADELLLEVRDDGRGEDPGANGGGHGLVGMRERVAVYGGDLTAGRRPEGGFGVVARPPLEGRRVW